MPNPKREVRLRPTPPQTYTRAEFPSIEESFRRVTGVRLPFVDITRGPGALLNNTAVVASHPLLSGLTKTEYAENEFFPPNATPAEVDVLSSPARWEPDSTDDLMDLVRRKSTISGPQETGMKSLLNKRGVLDGLRASRSAPTVPGEGA